MTAAPRPAAQRKADALAKLATPGIDVWVATASPADGGTARPYLVPLSLAWAGERAVIAVEAGSRTARNLAATREARLAVGPTRDVVVIDAVLDGAVPVAEAAAGLADRYAAQADWDPREAGKAATSTCCCAPSGSRPGARPTSWRAAR